jgi:serine/threonine protein kinase
MSRLRHANVIPFLGFTTTPQCLIIQELAHNGDVRTYLQAFARAPQGPPSMQQLVMAVDIARGMEYLHTFPGSPVLHRDLKTPNLLLDRDFRVKITDFGISREKELSLGQTGIMTVCGTPIWTAPEILRGDTYNEKADVFSFSICVWEVRQRPIVCTVFLLSFSVPNKGPAHCLQLWGFTMPYAELGLGPVEVAIRVLGDDLRPQVLPSMPHFFADLMQRCWAGNPADRPCFQRLPGQQGLVVEIEQHAEATGVGKISLPVDSQLPLVRQEESYDSGIGSVASIDSDGDHNAL